MEKEVAEIINNHFNEVIDQATSEILDVFTKYKMTMSEQYWFVIKLKEYMEQEIPELKAAFERSQQ